MPGHEMGANHNLKNRDNMDIHKGFHFVGSNLVHRRAARRGRLLLRRPSIILKLFFGHSGVLGGVLGEVLWRSVSSPAFVKWRGISSPLMGSSSGSLVSMPARADFFAGLRALAVGAGNCGSFSSPVPAEGAR